ncbi:MAG TPA: DinB family protein [Puia sp.]|jgi:uncharacterized damage-inducible protein DinB|nr:DinB family protein [Puia sp.]
MEITTIRSFIDYQDKVRSRTDRLLKVVRPDQLDFAYLPGKFTIGDQIRHIAAIERWMFAETLAGRPSAYHGCGKELADGYDNVMNYYRELRSQAREIIVQLGDAGLHRKCLTPGNVEITAWKWLRSLIEHEIHHRGELYIYLNLIGVTTPPMFGLTAEEVQKASIP